ncbi:uncharacterized protein [Diadema setosum]|uniref:uncharacterized protein n=1 Tax=Diadema setosum TaxID=31175 RepID=UPI003B3A25B8
MNMAASNSAELRRGRGKWTLVDEEGNIQGSDSDVGSSSSSSSDCVDVKDDAVHFRSKRANSRSSTGSGGTSPSSPKNRPVEHTEQHVPASTSWLGGLWTKGKGQAPSALAQEDEEPLPSPSIEDKDHLDTASLESIEVLPMPSDNPDEDDTSQLGMPGTMTFDPLGEGLSHGPLQAGSTDVAEAAYSTTAVTPTHSLSPTSQIDSITSSSNSSQLDFLMVDHPTQAQGGPHAPEMVETIGAGEATGVAEASGDGDGILDQEQGLDIAGPLPIMPQGQLPMSSVSVDNIPRGVEAGESPRRTKSTGNLPKQTSGSSVGVPIMTQRWPTEDGGFLLVQQFRGDGEPAMSRSSSFSDLSSSFSCPDIRRRIPDTSSSSLQHQTSSDASSEVSHFSDTSNDALPANMTVSGIKPGIRQYLHRRDEGLNSRLNQAALLVLTAALALSLGHYIGSSQATSHHLGIEAGQVWRLRSLQDQLVTCLDKTKTLLRGKIPGTAPSISPKPDGEALAQVTAKIPPLPDSGIPPPAATKITDSCSPCADETNPGVCYSAKCNIQCGEAGEGPADTNTAEVADESCKRGDATVTVEDGQGEVKEDQKLLEVYSHQVLDGPVVVLDENDDVKEVRSGQQEAVEEGTADPSETIPVSGAVSELERQQGGSDDKDEGVVVEVDRVPVSHEKVVGQDAEDDVAEMDSEGKAPGEMEGEMEGSLNSESESAPEEESSSFAEDAPSKDDEDSKQDSNLIDQLSSKLSDSWFVLRNLTTDLVGSASNLSVNNLTTQLKENVETLRHQIKDAVDSLQKSNVTFNLKESVHNVGDQIQNAVNNLTVGNITGTIKGGLQGITEQVQDSVAAIQKSNITSQIREGVQTVSNKIQDAISVMPDGKTISQRVKKPVKKTLKSVHKFLGDAFSGGKDETVEEEEEAKNQLFDSKRDRSKKHKSHRSSKSPDAAPVKDKKGMKSKETYRERDVSDSAKTTRPYDSVNMQGKEYGPEEKPTHGGKKKNRNKENSGANHQHDEVNGRIKHKHSKSKELSESQMLRDTEKHKANKENNQRKQSEAQSDFKQVGKKHKEGERKERKEHGKSSNADRDQGDAPYSQQQEIKPRKQDKRRERRQKFQSSVNGKESKHQKREDVAEEKPHKQYRAGRQHKERKHHRHHEERRKHHHHAESHRHHHKERNHHHHRHHHHHQTTSRSHQPTGDHSRHGKEGKHHHHQDQDWSKNNQRRDDQAQSKGEDKDKDRLRFQNVNLDDLFEAFDSRCHGVKDCLRKQREAAVKLYQELLAYEEWLTERCYSRHLEELQDFMEELEEFLAEPAVTDADLAELMEDFEDMAEDIEKATTKYFRKLMKERKWEGKGGRQEQPDDGRSEQMHVTVTLDLKEAFNFSDMNTIDDQPAEKVEESDKRKHAGYGYQSNDDWFIRRMHDREKQREEAGNLGDEMASEGDERDTWYQHWMKGREEGRAGMTVWDLYEWFSKRQALRHEWRMHEMDDQSNWFLRRP